MSSSGGIGRGRGGKGPATFFLRQLSQFSPRSSSSSHDPQSRGSGSPGLGESMERMDLTSGGDGDGTDRRTEVILVHGNLMPVGKKPNAIATACTVSFKMYVDPMGYTWKTVTEEFKLTYWNEFVKQFRWSAPLTDGKVYELWLKKAGRRYTDFVSGEKNSRSITGRSPYISEEIWAAWCKYWDSEECKKKSATAKKNRLSEPDGPGTGVARHRGGSKSAVAYSYEMARDKGISIRDTVYPTFQKLHYNEAEKSYTNAKAKRIAEEVEFGLEDLNQSLPDGVSPTPADTTEIFVGAAQNPKKNRVFGCGTLYSPPSVSSRWEAGGSGFPSMGIDDERYQKLQAEYEAEKEQRQALERRQGGLEESHHQLQQSHQELLGEFKHTLGEFKQTKLLLEQLLRRDTQTDE